MGLLYGRGSGRRRHALLVLAVRLGELLLHPVLLEK